MYTVRFARTEVAVNPADNTRLYVGIHGLISSVSGDVEYFKPINNATIIGADLKVTVGGLGDATNVTVQVGSSGVGSESIGAAQPWNAASVIYSERGFTLAVTSAGGAYLRIEPITWATTNPTSVMIEGTIILTDDNEESDLSGAKADILTNDSDISSHLVSITSNASDILINQSSISDNASAILTNDSDISANAANIATNQATLLAGDLTAEEAATLRSVTNMKRATRTQTHLKP